MVNGHHFLPKSAGICPHSPVSHFNTRFSYGFSASQRSAPAISLNSPALRASFAVFNHDFFVLIPRQSHSLRFLGQQCIGLLAEFTDFSHQALCHDADNGG